MNHDAQQKYTQFSRPVLLLPTIDYLSIVYDDDAAAVAVLGQAKACRILNLSSRSMHTESRSVEEKKKVICKQIKKASHADGVCVCVSMVFFLAIFQKL